MVTFQHQIAQKIANVNAAWRIHLIGDFEDVAPTLRDSFTGGELRVKSHNNVDAFCRSEQALGVLLMDLGKIVVEDNDIRDVKERFVGRETIYVIDDACASHAINLVRYGVHKFLVRPFGTEALLRFVEDAVRRECLRTVGNEIQSWQKANWEMLTPREQVICKHLVMGFGNTEIAGMLDVRPDTVKKHRSSILEKMQARSLSDLVRAFKCFDCSLDSALDCFVATWSEVSPLWHSLKALKNGSH